LGIATLRLIIFGETIIPRCYAGCFSYKDQQPLGLLAEIKPISGTLEYIFPADRNRKMHTNAQTANSALKRMGFEKRLVSHGLRALASTTLNENDFNYDIVEAALAHSDSNEVRAAYNRATYLQQRREMMQWWSDHIDEATKTGLFNRDEL
ncbi:MAG: hypothetical protein CBB67_018085, partial [Alteromonadaceae bacterium TMED7]